jgi:hypothetical protein
MIREKMTENSVNALMYIAPTGMWSFQRRTLEGATTVSTKSNVKAVKYPTWVRLVRSGSDIYAYFSADGKTWQLADAIVMNLPDNVYVGIAVTSHTNTKLSKAVVDNITVKAGATATMPVEVTNFNAIAAPDRARVELSWNTVTEINNDYFVVERSEDGSSFEPIDQIASLGNSTTTQSYTAFDAAPIEGIAYYRLRYNGKEGTFTYTSVIEVNYAPKPAGTMNIFPNPVPAGTAFSVDVLYPGVTSARLELRNLQGTIVATRKNLDCSTTKRVTFKETLTPGIYYLTAIDVTGAKKPFTMKVVIQ